MSANWLRVDDAQLASFAELCEQPVDTTKLRFANDVVDRTVVYESTELRAALMTVDRADVLAELAWVFADGPGVIVLAQAFEAGPVDAMTEQYWDLIADQHAIDAEAGDHFAKPGANDRVWNALEKVALAAPEVFIDYYENDMLALACEAWLGPWYQISSQVNVVNPGGEAQHPHRDYHLGFLSDDQAERFPAHVHRLSPVMTLQGAIAHCDMPVDAGPTTYLPNSQRFEHGYLAWRRDDFAAYFADHHVQPSLAKGDAVFFNPALFHAAGSNTTPDVKRIANLLQIGSGLGRLLEQIDRSAMCRAIYPRLLVRLAAGMDRDAVDRVVAATAEGYPFPTNLDRDPPIGGMVPESQADLMRSALDRGASPDDVARDLDAHATKRLTR